MRNKQVRIGFVGLFLGLIIYAANALQAPPPGQLPPREPPSPQPPFEPPPHRIQSLEGVALYMAYCASCHGRDGKGYGPASPALKTPPPDLTRLSQRYGGKFPREFVEKTILGEDIPAVAHGSREMPVWGPIFGQIEWDRDLRNVRVRNLSMYLESIQERVPPPSE
ncbi:MAG TPA: cytochrome c [Terriglobia bacterium]|nr:cytochrome c [Terriglobia bacterium]